MQLGSRDAVKLRNSRVVQGSALLLNQELRLQPHSAQVCIGSWSYDGQLGAIPVHLERHLQTPLR